MTLSELLTKLEILGVKGKIATVDGNSPNLETGDVSSNAQIFKEELQNEINDAKNQVGTLTEIVENIDNLTQNNFFVGSATNTKEEKSISEVYNLLNIDNNIDSKINQQLNYFNVTITSDIQTSKNSILGGASSQYDTLKKIEDLIMAIQTVLNSDDTDLDTVQEIVNYIKNNKNTLDLLSVSSILGLQQALDTKVDNVAGKELSDNNLTDALKLKLENSDNLTQNNFFVGSATNTKEEKSISEVYNLLNIDNNIMVKMIEVLSNFQVTVTSDIQTSKNSILGGASSDYDTLKKIEDLIIAIQTVLNSDDSTLDTVQELVDYIKNNKSTLDSLGISSILGLQTALDAKVDNVAGKELSENDLTDALLSQFLLYETTKVDKISGKELSDNNLTNALKTLIENSLQKTGQNVNFPQNIYLINGDFFIANARAFSAKTSQDTYEPFLWARWLDDRTFFNFGAGGFFIRDNNYVSALTIKNGNIGLGSSDPSNKLDIYGGDIALSFGNCIKVNNDGFGSNKILDTQFADNYNVTNIYSAASQTTTQRQPTMRIANDRIGVNINPNPSYTVNVGGNVGASVYLLNSDKKIKENIKDLPIQLIDRLLNVELKQFNYIEKDSTQYGVIAQQLEKIGLSELVVTAQEYEIFQTKEEAEKFISNKPHLEAKIKKFKVKKQKEVFVFNKKQFKTIEDAKKVEGELNGKPSQIESKFIEYDVDNFKCFWEQKSVNYNNLFILQQALINDLKSVLKTQNLFFSIDDIVKVYDNVVDDSYEVLTKDGNLIKSIEKNNNSQHKRIIEFIQNGGKVEEKIDKEEIIKKLKKETTKRIATINKKEYDNISWLYKSQNLQDIKQSYTIQQLSETQIPKEDKISRENYNEACKILKRKDMHIKDYKILKNKILKMNKKDLINFEVNDNENWTETKKENQKSILKKALKFIGLGN